MTNEQITLPQESEPLSDIFNFPWLLFKASEPIAAYTEMGRRGNLPRILVLAAANSLALSMTLIWLVIDNPYIPLNDYLRYGPFAIALVVLPFIGFLVYSMAHFLCFRTVSGKGNLTVQCYLTAISSTNYVLLFWLAIAILYITHARGIDMTILVLGGLYLLIPSIASLAAIHKISLGRFVGGFILSVIASIPLYILYQLSLGFLAEAHSGDVSLWVIATISIVAVALAAFVVAYLHQQSKLVAAYPLSVPVKQPLMVMFGKIDVEVVEPNIDDDVG